MMDFVNGVCLLAAYDAYFLSKAVHSREAESFLEKIEAYKRKLLRMRPKAKMAQKN